jgi:hypothetical protein
MTATHIAKDRFAAISLGGQMPGLGRQLPTESVVWAAGVGQVAAIHQRKRPHWHSD